METLGFDYGQRHRVELDCRERLRTGLQAMAWPGRLGPDHLLTVDVLAQLGGSAMTDEVTVPCRQTACLTPFVPGRNLLFFTLAAALAYRRGLDVLVGGMSGDRLFGYPDCRDNTLKALQVALSLGVDRRLTLETPLMWFSIRAATWQMAQDLGGAALVELIRRDSHSCYLGERGCMPGAMAAATARLRAARPGLGHSGRASGVKKPPGLKRGGSFLIAASV